MLSIKNNKNIKPSEPIDIINKSNVSLLQNNILKNTIDYKLDFNKFDPSKFSPPDNWKNRLKSRLKKYDNINKNNDYINYFSDSK